VKEGVGRQYLLVGIAGGIGTLCRFLVSECFGPHVSWPPLTTLIINFTGSLLIGSLQALSEPESRFYLSPSARLVLMTGFCGGYTTFSTYSLLSFYSLQHADWGYALLNVLASSSFGIFAVFAGYFVSNGMARLLETRARRVQQRKKRS
jgi:CrcB protein